jgi:hypothetical protein
VTRYSFKGYSIKGYSIKGYSIKRYHLKQAWFVLRRRDIIVRIGPAPLLLERLRIELEVACENDHHQEGPHGLRHVVR